MRVTNNMITANTKYNINANKVLVDKYNTQMTTHKKINKPSDDPVIAIRSLRMQTNLEHLTQYLDNNIEDANAWIDVTHTALDNMMEILTRIRTQCVNGSTDTKEAKDRDIILKELQSLQEQVYSEANADYAGRTVFTGYRTNCMFTFKDDEPNTTYGIKENFTYEDLKEQRYYYGRTEIPIDTEEECDVVVGTEAHNRLRLAYDKLDALNETDEKVKVVTVAKIVDITSVPPGTIPEEYTLPLDVPAGKTEYYEDKSTGKIIQVTGVGVKYGLSTINTRQVVDPATLPTKVDVEKLPTEADWIAKNNGTALKLGEPDYYKNENGEIIKVEAKAVKVYDTEQDWIDVRTNQDITSEDYHKVTELEKDDIVLIKDKGELIFGDEIAHKISQDKASIEVNYTKTGFAKHEPRPEYFFDCTMKTPDMDNKVVYTKQEQKITYVISYGITLPVNTEASDIITPDVGRDVSEMIDIVSAAINANEKVDKIKQLMQREQFSDEKSQDVLGRYLVAAEKEASYANDHLQKTFRQYITNFDHYLEKVNIGITNIGGLQKRLDMTQNRVENQKMTVELLKSGNEDRDISDIIIDYYAAYNAYTASLTAASKVGQQTLLNYL